MACSCLSSPAPSVAFAGTDAVFIGEVTHVENHSRNRLLEFIDSILDEFGLSSGFYPPGYGRSVTFNVKSAWKGVSTTVANLRTGNSDADCGYPFDVGSEYVVYGHRSEGQLIATICSRTSVLSDAAEDQAFLSTVPTISLASGPAAGGGVALILICAGLAAILVFWEIRRRRAAS